MFTGIIEALGTVSALSEDENSREFEISAPFSQELTLGQSVAVDGACLTVTSMSDEAFAVRAINTTLGRTVAGSYELGRVVNLERAVPLGHRMDGHLVQGHVDGLAPVVSRRNEGETWFLEVELPEAVAEVTILHGSVTLNGVSLTVNGLGPGGRCEVALIPHTWEHTNLSQQSVGDALNVEGDVIGKYVQRLAEAQLRKAST